MSSFLHGIETITVSQGSRPVNIVKSGVIGLVGIAPTGPANVLVPVYPNSGDAAAFGAQVPGFNIPQALEVIFNQGAGVVLVVNVFNATKHLAQVTDEVKTVTNGTLKLAAAPIGAVTIKDSEDEPVAFEEGTDYSIDAYGNFKVLSTAIANTTVLKFSYKKLDISLVEAADLVGTYNGTTNVRTGMQCFDTAFNALGFNPKIFISPSFTTMPAVLTGLASCAAKFKGIVYHDAPLGTTINAAIAGRGPAGTFGFNTSDKRVELLYPHLKKYDPATNENVNFPYSAFMAGIRAALDNSDGFWFSSSNKEIKGATGIERELSSSTTDVNSDTNRLNAAGITTVFNTFGSGNRTWGNRNASFPVNTGADSFSNIVRIDDVVTDSLEQAALQFVDLPITQGLIDTIRESGNAFIRVLIGRGALLPGSMIKYNKSDNPVEELANGHITFERIYMGPTPAERITFKSVLDINLLASIA